MAITLAIKRNTRADKLRAMEALRVDFSQDETRMRSPDWHAEALRETEGLVREGKAKFSDGHEAKRRIQRKADKLA